MISRPPQINEIEWFYEIIQLSVAAESFTFSLLVTLQTALMDMTKDLDKNVAMELMDLWLVSLYLLSISVQETVHLKLTFSMPLAKYLSWWSKLNCLE